MQGKRSEGASQDVAAGAAATTQAPSAPRNRTYRKDEAVQVILDDARYVTEEVVCNTHVLVILQIEKVKRPYIVLIVQKNKQGNEERGLPWTELLITAKHKSNARLTTTSSTYASHGGFEYIGV